MRQAWWVASWVAVLAVAVVMAWASLATTREFGVGLSNDSRSYIVAARSIAAGEMPADVNALGVSRIQTHFPPGYGALLAATGRETRVAARYVNALLLIASTLTCAAIIALATRSPGRTTLAASLFAFAAGTSESHLFLWSEPPFQLFMLATMLFLGLHLKTSARRWLVLAALAACAAFMTRLAGVVVIGSGLIALWIGSTSRPRRERLIDLATFGILAAAPTFAWLLYVSSGTGTVASRTIAYVPVPLAKIENALDVLSEWILYRWQADRLRSMAALLTIELILWMLWRTGRTLHLRRRDVRAEPLSPWAVMPFVYLLAYPLFLAISISWIDEATPLDRRILYPMHVAAIVLLCLLIPLASIWLRAIAVGLVALQAASAHEYLQTSRAIGLGYASRKWHRSPALRFIRGLPADAKIMSNNALLVDLAADRRTVQLPSVDTAAAATRPALATSAMNRLNWQLKGGAYYIRLLDPPGSVNRHVTQPQLESFLHVRRLKKYRDGSIYFVEPRVSATTAPTTGPTTPSVTTASSTR